MVTMPVSCGRGESSLKMTSLPRMKNSTPKTGAVSTFTAGDLAGDGGGHLLGLLHRAGLMAHGIHDSM